MAPSSKARDQAREEAALTPTPGPGGCGSDPVPSNAGPLGSSLISKGHQRVSRTVMYEGESKYASASASLSCDRILLLCYPVTGSVTIVRQDPSMMILISKEKQRMIRTPTGCFFVLISSFVLSEKHARVDGNLQVQVYNV